MNKVVFLNLYVDMYAANLWPSVGSLAPGVWPAELTHHLPAVLACCLLRQQGVISVRPLFWMLQDLCQPLLTHQLGWHSPIPSSLPFKAASHPLGVK